MATAAFPHLTRQDLAGERVFVHSFAHWRDAVQGLFPGFDPQSGDDSFSGDYVRRGVGDLGFTEMGAQRYVMQHERLDHRAASKPGCCLILQLEGRARMSQAGREVILSPGDLTLIDGTRPAQFIYEGRYRQLAVQLPYRAVTQRFGTALPSARLLPAHHALPTMVRDMAMTIFKGVTALPSAQGPRLRDTLLDLLGVAFEHGPAAHSGLASGRPETQLLAIKHHIAGHLADPDLSPSTIAVAHGLSLRHLHRIFAATGMSIGEWILEQRLERCHADLANPQLARHAIGDIAMAWGFNGFSHFSRSFKTRYGVTPREWRHASVSS